MTLKTLWRRHVAWRFRAQPPASEANCTTCRISSEANPPCTKCRKPVEDVAFKYCRACRAMATKSSKKRARRHKREGRCPKCGGPRGMETIVCSACLAQGRATYHNRKG